MFDHIGPVGISALQVRNLPGESPLRQRQLKKKDISQD